MWPLLQWKSNNYYIFWVCICSLKYPAYSEHAPYCHLWPVQLYHIFPRFQINGTIFEKYMIEHKMCLLIFSTISSETFLILWTIERDFIINVYWSSCKVPVSLVRVQWNVNLFERLSKNKCQISWKSVQWEPSCSVRADGQTDMTKLIVALRNSTNALKNCRYIKMCHYIEISLPHSLDLICNGVAVHYCRTDVQNQWLKRGPFRSKRVCMTSPASWYQL